MQHPNRHRSITRHITTILLCCLVSGCGQDDGQSTSPSSDATINVSEPLPGESAPDATTEEIKLAAASWSEIESEIASHHGSVVVVDLWSTSCIPCIAELPHLGELQRTFGDVACISVSVDYLGIKSKPVEFYRERVENVLQRCNVTALNYLCTVDSDTLFAELDLSAIPAVFVYDQNGTLVQRFDDSLLTEESEDGKPFTYERDIVPLVKRLIRAEQELLPTKT